MLLAMGHDDGVGQFNALKLPRCVVAFGKSRDLLLWKSWREMNQKAVNFFSICLQLQTHTHTHTPFSLLPYFMQAACWSLQHSFFAHFITFCPGLKAAALSTPGHTLDKNCTI